jgi:hypothetical protein
MTLRPGAFVVEHDADCAVIAVNSLGVTVFVSLTPFSDIEAILRDRVGH